MSFSEKTGELLRKLFPFGEPYTTAVILAAGLGTRMASASGETKQLRMISGKPLVIHTLIAFEKCPHIRDIVLVVRKEETAVMRALIENYKIRKVRAVTVGGHTRQESALAGFTAIGRNAEYVAVHDAARCLVTPEIIGDVVKAAYSFRAATAGYPSVDTVKIVTDEGYIVKTIPRESTFCAATPQVFRTDLYRAALYAAEKDRYAVTDDNMLLEHIGQAIKTVNCGLGNFKVTTEEDMIRAETVLDLRLGRVKPIAGKRRKKRERNDLV